MTTQKPIDRTTQKPSFATARKGACRSMREAIIRLHKEEILSEGQAAKILKCSRIQVRIWSDAA